MDTVNDKNYAQKVLEAKQPVLVDFFATWCGPCKQVTPILEDLAKSRSDIIFVKVNIEESPAFTDQQEVTAVPTLVLFKEGKVIAKKEGGDNKAGLTEWLEESLKNG